MIFEQVSDSRPSLLSLVAAVDLLPVHAVIHGTPLTSLRSHSLPVLGQALQERPECSTVVNMYKYYVSTIHTCFWLIKSTTGIYIVHVPSVSSTI